MRRLIVRSNPPCIGLIRKRMFKTANEFSLHIEQIVKEKKVNYMDAVLEYCKENYIEPEDVASLINKSLKDKIEMDFRELNYLPKQAQLDV
jgi:KaiC/GvpD/RAD55 family RecA-like ATPase